MRLNQFLAMHTELSRRAADREISSGNVSVNGQTATLGTAVNPEKDKVALHGQQINTDTAKTTIMFNKPVGYVCSKDGQGSNTIYDILPKQYRNLNPIGRLDKNSSGLLLLTNDGKLANELAHPRYSKQKIYNVVLDKPLAPLHQQMISDHGIELEDGNSRLILQKLDEKGYELQVTMSEGRNRQIRRTFFALGYKVKKLHRISFGDFKIGNIKTGETVEVISQRYFKD